MSSVTLLLNADSNIAVAVIVSAAMIIIRRPYLSASGATNKQPTAIPSKLALNSTPRRSGLTDQSSDKTGAMKDMISKSAPSSMLNRKQSVTTSARVGVQTEASCALELIVVPPGDSASA